MVRAHYGNEGGNTMKQKTIGFAALVCAAILFTESAAAAPVTYEGTLCPGVAGAGTVPTGDGWITNSGDEVNFWRFFAPAGKQVDVLMRALSNALDPAFSIYAGTTTADTSLFDNAGDWDALTFIDFGATAFGGGGE